MRRRKLYRYAQNPWSPRPRVVDHPDQRIVQQQISEFDRGVQHGLHLARQQQDRFSAEARREALVAAQGTPYLIMARRGGFDEGFAAGMRAAQSAAGQKSAQFTYADVEAARRRGFEEGRSTTSQVQRAAPSMSETSIRQKAVEDMLESCRVIAESNPNMNSESFLKAVRQRSKKIT